MKSLSPLRRLFGTGALLAILVTSSAAFADPAPNADFQKGLAAFDKRDYPAAVESFRRAYAADPRELHLWNLALAEAKTKQFIQAYKHLLALRAGPKLDADHEQKFPMLFTAVKNGLVGVTIDAPIGSTVSIDNDAVGIAPLAEPIYVTPGETHVADAHHDGKRGSERIAPFPAGSSTGIVLKFPAPPPAVPPLAKPTAVQSAKAPGAAPSYGVRNALVAGQAGLAVVALGAGIFFNVQASDAGERASQIRTEGTCTAPSAPGCTALKEQVERNHDGHTAGIVFYAASGALALGAAATYLLWPRASSQTTAWAAPALDGRGGSVGFLRRF
jgi:hypothetical protein